MSLQITHVVLVIGKMVPSEVLTSKVVTGVAVLAFVLPLPCCPLLQVSKLTTVLLRACRTAAGCSSWDPLVAGVAVGKLVEVDELDPLVLAGKVANSQTEGSGTPSSSVSGTHNLNALAGCRAAFWKEMLHKRKALAACRRLGGG